MSQYCVGPTMATEWEGVSQAAWDRRLIRRALGYFVPYWRRATVTLLFIAAGAAVSLAPAFVARRLIDGLANHSITFGHVLALVGAGIAAAVVGALLFLAETYLSNTISQRIMSDLRRLLFEKLLGQTVAFYTKSRTGEVMSRIGNDVGRIDTVLSETVFGVAQNTLIGLATAAFMFWLDWRLTLVALLGLPLAVVPTKRIGRAAFRARQRTQAKLAELTSYLQEVLSISGILLVKAFGKQRAEKARFSVLNDDLRRLELRQTMINRGFGALMGGLVAAGPAALWVYGGYLVIHREASVGTVATLGTVLTFRLYGAIADLGNLNVNLVGSLALFSRLFEYLDLDVDVVEAPDARPLPRSAGAVSFDAVTFTYRRGLRPALQDVTFDIEPGQLVALVGRSGAGKTTLSSLVSRFYDPTAGSVRIDGHDLRDVTLESLSDQIGIVFQDTFLFHASIRENLTYARPEASQEDLDAAIAASSLADFVASLPDGYETVVGERGYRLSGGEKQRLALARVILKDPPILVLDEATSHLDSVSERLIQAALTRLFEHRTSIVIAHRLSTILAADVIFVLDRGRLVERGDHASLLANGGPYAELYERQFLDLEEPQVATH